MGREGEGYKQGCGGCGGPGAAAGGGGMSCVEGEPENILAGNLRGNAVGSPGADPAIGWGYPPGGVIGWQHLSN